MTHNHNQHCHHHGKPDAETIVYLIWSFIINIVLSVIELIAGLFSGSVALIGDALHNTSDAFSILIAVFAYKIGQKKSNKYFTYGFKRSEVIGAFVNLILLFISAVYLVFEGISKLIKPEAIDGWLIIWVSLIALFVDAATAKLSHQNAHHNSNMKMLFLHNLADALGSIGVIISGLCIVYMQWTFVDGIIALLIAGYMLFHSFVEFPKITKILMNATPEGVDIDEIKKQILKINEVSDVHHIHVWNICENVIALECHIVSDNLKVIANVKEMLIKHFGIIHTNIQVETNETECRNCCV